VDSVDVVDPEDEPTPHLHRWFPRRIELQVQKLFVAKFEGSERGGRAAEHHFGFQHGIERHRGRHIGGDQGDGINGIDTTGHSALLSHI